MLNPLFLSALLLLILNDHLFKWQFHNWLTGKLSDVCGIILLPLLLSFLFKIRLTWSMVFSAALFVFWKSPYSDGFIEFYNSFNFFPITRTVDYSDLWVILILPLVYHFFETSFGTGLPLFKFKLIPWFVALICCFAFIATSLPPEYYFRYSEGDLQYYDMDLKVPMTPDKILSDLRAMGLVVSSDTSFVDNIRDRSYPLDSTIDSTGNPFYVIDQFILENDTVSNIRFAMTPLNAQKTKIYINDMDLDQKLNNPKILRKLSRHYKKAVKKEVFQEMRK